MQISSAVAQLRTTDLAASIHFYTSKVGLTLEFQYEDFYAGIRAGDQVFHLKFVDEKDPSIDFVDNGDHFHLYFGTDDAIATAEALKRNGVQLVKDVHDTAWGTREFVIKDKVIRCTSANSKTPLEQRRAGEDACAPSTDLNFGSIELLKTMFTFSGVSALA